MSSIDVLIIGTTHFVNALIQRKKLAKTGIIRLSLPAGGGVLPFADWPDSLVKSINGTSKLIHGGYEMDGNEISKLEPWIQWVSIHTGLDAHNHKIFRLGEINNYNSFL